MPLYLLVSLKARNTQYPTRTGLSREHGSTGAIVLYNNPGVSCIYFPMRYKQKSFITKMHVKYQI